MAHGWKPRTSLPMRDARSDAAGTADRCAGTAQAQAQAQPPACMYEYDNDDQQPYGMQLTELRACGLR